MEVKKGFSLWFYLISIVIIILVGFNNRGVYSKPFDFKYTRDLYDHSQWTLAKTVRVISDNQEYQVAGYEAIKYGELFKTNPEVPPYGKYLIGLSIVFFGNAETLSYLLYILSGVIFYLLCREIFQKKSSAQIATLLFFSEPLIFSQASLSMLDLPLLGTLLIHVLSVVLLLKTRDKKIKPLKRLIFIILAGVSFGAFLATKFGFFAIIILFADAIIFHKKRGLLNLLYILLIGAFFYILMYLPYFLHGSSFIEFLKAQKWMLHFYLLSKVKPLYGMAIVSLISGFYQNWSKGSYLSRFQEWTILWPAYLLSLSSFILTFIKKREKSDDNFFYLGLLTTGFLLFCIVIPFWVRYLVIILPLLIIFFVQIIPKINKKLLMFIFLIYIIQVATFLYHPLDRGDVENISRMWSVGSYQDLYESLDSSSKGLMSRSNFWRDLQKFEKDLGVKNKSVNIKFISKYPWEYPQVGSLTINYQTPLGPLTNTKKINFVRESGLWKIKWEDNLVFDNFRKIKVEANYENGILGKLKTEKGTILSEGQPRPLFWVTPKNIKDEDNLQKQLYKLTRLKKYDLELFYKANNQPDWPAEIAFLTDNLDPSVIEKMVLDPSISIQIKETRVHNKLLFKKPKLLKLVQKKEIGLSPILNPKVGGTIKVMVDGQVKKTITRQKEDGKDVTINGIDF